MLGLALVAQLGAAVECFPKSDNKLPHVFVENGPSQNDERYLSIVGNDDFIIAGGHSSEPNLTYDDEDYNGIIMRMDIATNRVRYMISLRKDMGYVEALALNNAAT